MNSEILCFVHNLFHQFTEVHALLEHAHEAITKVFCTLIVNKEFIFLFQMFLLTNSLLHEHLNVTWFFGCVFVGTILMHFCLGTSFPRFFLLH